MCAYLHESTWCILLQTMADEYLWLELTLYRQDLCVCQFKHLLGIIAQNN